MKAERNHGFTLVELIVVIAIVAILAATTIVGYQRFINQAKVSVAMQESERIKTEIEGYFLGGASHFSTFDDGTYKNDYTVTHDYLSNSFNITITSVTSKGINPNTSKKAGNVLYTLQNALVDILDDVVIKRSVETGLPDPKTLVVGIESYTDDEISFIYNHSDGIAVEWTATLIMIEE